MRKQFSRFKYKGPHLNQNNVSKYHHPTYRPFDIVCDMCKKVLYDCFEPEREELSLFTTPLEEQIGVHFYSVVEGDQSIQYCKTCKSVLEVAPL